LQLQDLEADTELFVFEELAPVDEEEKGDNDKAGGEDHDSLPVGLAVEEVGQVGAGVFTGKHQHAIRDEAAEKKRGEDVPRADAGHGDGGEQRGRGKRREGVEKNENRGRPLCFGEFVSNVAKVRVLAAIHERGRDARNVTGKNVTPDRGTEDADADGEPWVQLKFYQQHDQNDPGRRREDGDGVDRKRREKDEQVGPHLWKLDTGYRIPERRSGQINVAGNSRRDRQNEAGMKRWFTGMLLIGSTAIAAPVNPVALQKAAAYSSSMGGTSFLAVQNGQTLLERNANEPHKIYSGTKAFWCLAALAAAEDGLLSLDEPVGQTIPAWRNDPRKARVTIRQLLDFSAGLEPVNSLHNDNPGDRDAIAIRAPILASPGSTFMYGPAALQVFHAVLKEKLQGESPTRYLERRVLRRMGLGSQRYLADSAGNPLLAAGWLLSARQWAKMGEVALNGGAPVVSAGSMAQCWRGSGANRAFSLGWWNNRNAPGGHEFDIEAMLVPRWHRQSWGGAVLCRNAPSDVVACIGSGYQRLYVIPSMNLVVVRNGSGRRFSDGTFLRLLVGR
jgi:CubicO group peptidase (beta-lactamase class C family)